MSKKFSIHHIVLLITVFFLLSAFAVFASISDTVKIDSIKIAKRGVKSGAVLILHERDTEKGNISVTGENSSKDKTIDRIEFSINGGKTWNRAEGVDSWRFPLKTTDHRIDDCRPIKRDYPCPSGIRWVPALRDGSLLE